MTSVELDIKAHDRPMTAKQAAAYLQIGLDRLRSWEKRAGLPTHRLGDGPKAERRYYAAELDAWLKSRCIAPTPDQGVA
jgi:excisionase family DNA binding protein